MGGGTGNVPLYPLSEPGLSPRGRGNLELHIQCQPVTSRVGSIPAWAGEPKLHPSQIRVGSIPASGEPQPNSRAPRVYPRVGGGTPDGPSITHPLDGSIPAWAGEPRKGCAYSIALNHTVYPRVGGGTPLGLRGWGIYLGLSPRGRGNPKEEQARLNAIRSIPAWAGEPRSCHSDRRSSSVYPRVGGGTRFTPEFEATGRGLSPRGRGNPIIRLVTNTPRSIPAWAGEPLLYHGRASGPLGLSPRGRGNPSTPPPPASKPKVYPRVGGGTPRVDRPSPRAGLSPRGRGNLVVLPVRGISLRSIPAWAGEPLTVCRSLTFYVWSIPAWAGEPAQSGRGLT